MFDRNPDHHTSLAPPHCLRHHYAHERADHCPAAVCRGCTLPGVNPHALLDHAELVKSWTV